MFDAGVQADTDLPPEGQPEKEAPPAIVETIELDDSYFSGILKEGATSIREALARLVEDEEAPPEEAVPAEEVFRNKQGKQVKKVPHELAPEERINPTEDPLEWVPHSPYVIPEQAREHRMKSSLSNEEYDGCFFGRGYSAFDEHTPIELIPPVMPNLPEGVQPGETIVYVNGISTPASMARWGMRMLADSTGSPVVGIYNATEGDIYDVAQAIGDKLQLGPNPSVDTLYHQIIRVTEHGGTLRILGDSQGALCVSRSLQMVQRELRRRGYSQDEVEDRLGRLHIETIGGAAWSYVDGPRYVHYINEYDPIPFRFGLSTYNLTDEEHAAVEAKLQEPGWLTGITSVLEFFDLDVLAVRHPGKNAQVIRFRGNQSDDWVQTHTIDKYLNHITPFQERPEGPEMKPDMPGPWTLFWRSMKWLGIVSTLYCVFSESRRILGRSLERAALNRAARNAQKDLGDDDPGAPDETAFNAGVKEAKQGVKELPGDLFRSILSLTT